MDPRAGVAQPWRVRAGRGRGGDGGRGRGRGGGDDGQQPPPYGVRGRGRGGGGDGQQPPPYGVRGRGRGGGGDGGAEAAALRVLYRVVFLGGEAARLVEYTGCVDTTGLDGRTKYHLVPLSAEHPQPVDDHAVLPRLGRAAAAVLSEPHVRWRAQFGSQVLCFGGAQGAAAIDVEAPLSFEKANQVLLTAPRTSFTARRFPSVADVMDVLVRELGAELEKAEFELVVKEKTKGFPFTYSRTASTLKELLDTAEFTLDSQPVEARAVVVTLLPPLPDGCQAADYTLYRCEGLRATAGAPTNSRRVKVDQQQSGVTATFIGDSISPQYVRVEERRVLSVPGSSAKLHVLHCLSEYGAFVATRRFPITVEAHDTPLPAPSSKAAAMQHLADFCALLLRVREALQGVVVDAPLPLHEDVAEHGACRGDAVAAPCTFLHCKREHMYTMCLKDAQGDCRIPSCNYWHAVSSVREMLAIRGSAVNLDSIPRGSLDVGLRYQAMLRTALSRHLSRFFAATEAAQTLLPQGCVAAHTHQQLNELQRELVEQYNAVVHTLGDGTPRSNVLADRCCRRLQHPLPLLLARDAVVAACRRPEVRCVLVDSSTGSGKSTQLPQYLAECASAAFVRREAVNSRGRQKAVLCVEPRLIAAQLLRDRVAQEYGGEDAAAVQRVRYVSYNEHLLTGTCDIAFMTVHTLLDLIRDNRIHFEQDVYAVVVDEAHERSVSSDMLLGLLKAEMARAPSLRVAVCSATLQSDLFRRYYPNSVRVSAEGRVHPVAVVHDNDCDAPRPSSDYVSATVQAVLSILRDPPTIPGAAVASGVPQPLHVLAFLPSASDVELALRSLERHLEQWGAVAHEKVEVLAVSGRQTPVQQRRVLEEVEPGVQKAIFATPIAETSVTIDGVAYVVDCGLTHVPRYDAVHHVTELAVCPVTQSAAIQRTGRAGRTTPGLCIRLYSKRAFTLLPKDAPPAVQTAALHSVALQLARLGYSMREFEWMEPPAPQAVEATLRELTVHQALQSAAGHIAAGVPQLTEFGRFLLRLESVSVPVGRMLYEAGRAGRDDFLALVALAAACIQLYPRMFSYRIAEKDAFQTALAAWGDAYDAGTHGDVVCLTRLVVRALHEFAGKKTDAAPAKDADAAMRFLSKPGLDELRRTQVAHFQSTVTALRLCAGQCGPNDVPFTSPEFAATSAGELQCLVGSCMGLQAALLSEDVTSSYMTVDAASRDCTLEATSFVRAQCARVGGRPCKLPSLCTFAALRGDTTTGKAEMRLCTPVQEVWLPATVREVLPAVRAQQLTQCIVELPSVLTDEWRVEEVTRWLSLRLDGGTCRVSSRDDRSCLVVRCTRALHQRARAVVQAAVKEATERHRSTCLEVALHGVCRVTCGSGCVPAEVLRDRKDFVTVLLTGESRAGMRCLALDLPAKVRMWGRQFCARDVSVTVRDGVAGAIHEGEGWTALVTFASCRDAADFYAGYAVAHRAGRVPARAEPFWEQDAPAAAMDSMTPVCSISVRLCVGYGDGEVVSGGDAVRRSSHSFPLEPVFACEQALRAVLPGGVEVKTHHVDRAQGVLHLQLQASSERLAHATLDVLHRVRGASCHYRTLFFGVVYAAEFPLPRHVNRELQAQLRSRVMTPTGNGDKAAGRVWCDALYENGHRAMLVRCATPRALTAAIAALQRWTAVHRCFVGEGSPMEKANAARAAAFGVSLLVSRLNAEHGTHHRVRATQFVFSEADGVLYFIGDEAERPRVEAQLQQLRDAAARTVCVALTLPGDAASARRCHAWLTSRVEECRMRSVPATVVMRGSTAMLLAPTDVAQLVHTDKEVAALWRAVNGEKNPQHKSTHVDAVMGSAAAAAEEAEEECPVCLCELQEARVRLLCGHQCCKMCLSSMFDCEGGAVPQLPVCCPACATPIAATELAQFASPAEVRRLGEFLRAEKVRRAETAGAEVKECPNQVCLGVPRVVTYDKRECGGCGLQYCEVCTDLGEVRGWHDGEPHLTQATLLADRLVKRLPFVPTCPRCGEACYDFTGCFAISCSQQHSFCGFCMAGCDRDAHGHVAHCQRNPNPGSYFALMEVFWQCRAEDLAAAITTTISNSKARSLSLVEAVAKKVYALMHDQWPRKPIDNAVNALRRMPWAAEERVAVAARGAEAVPPPPKEPPAHNLQAVARPLLHAAQTAVALLSGLPVPITELLGTEPGTDATLVAAVRQVELLCALDLTPFVDDALELMGDADEAAVALYAVFDVERRLEEFLRSLGDNWVALEELQPYWAALLRGIQRRLMTTPTLAERSARLTLEQRAAYTCGEVVKWTAPAVCTPVRVNSNATAAAGRDDGRVLFLVRCVAYATCPIPGGNSDEQVVLPAGVHLRVLEVVRKPGLRYTIRLEQESEFAAGN